MHLTTLKNCDIYRDGGSYEGIWHTSENKEWAICLLVSRWMDNDADTAFENRTYMLYNCELDRVEDFPYIPKDSQAYQRIIDLVNNWMYDNNLTHETLKQEQYGRAYDMFKDFARITE